MHYEPPPEQSTFGPAEAIIAFIVCVIIISYLISLVL